MQDKVSLADRGVYNILYRKTDILYTHAVIGSIYVLLSEPSPINIQVSRHENKRGNKPLIS